MGTTLVILVDDLRSALNTIDHTLLGQLTQNCAKVALLLPWTDPRVWWQLGGCCASPWSLAYGAPQGSFVSHII